MSDHLQHERLEPDPQEVQERRDRELEKAPAPAFTETADCFLHGRYDVDEYGVGRCPVCNLGTGPE